MTQTFWTFRVAYRPSNEGDLRDLIGWQTETPSWVFRTRDEAKSAATEDYHDRCNSSARLQ